MGVVPASPGARLPRHADANRRPRAAPSRAAIAGIPVDVRRCRARSRPLRPSRLVTVLGDGQPAPPSRAERGGGRPRSPARTARRLYHQRTMSARPSRSRQAGRARHPVGHRAAGARKRGQRPRALLMVKLHVHHLDAHLAPWSRSGGCSRWADDDGEAGLFQVDVLRERVQHPLNCSDLGGLGGELPERT